MDHTWSVVYPQGCAGLIVQEVELGAIRMLRTALLALLSFAVLAPVSADSGACARGEVQTCGKWKEVERTRITGDRNVV